MSNKHLDDGLVGVYDMIYPPLMDGWVEEGLAVHTSAEYTGRIYPNYHAINVVIYLVGNSF